MTRPASHAERTDADEAGAEWTGREPWRGGAPRRRGRARSAAIGAALGALAVLAGCYTYAVPQGALRGGTRIRVGLTDAGSDALAGYLGRGVESVEGTYLPDSDSAAVVVAVTTTTRGNGVESYWSGERVSIPRTAVASIRERRLSRSRTGLTAAAVVAGVVGLGSAFGSAISGGGPHGNPPPPK
jgi:hypothetical protein